MERPNPWKLNDWNLGILNLCNNPPCTYSSTLQNLSFHQSNKICVVICIYKTISQLFWILAHLSCLQYEKSTMAYIGDWSCCLYKSNLKNRRTWRVLESVVELGHTFVFLIRATLGELKKLGMDSLSGGHSCHQVFINDTDTVSKLFHWNCWKIFFHFGG